jgi:hypothetical protein
MNFEVDDIVFDKCFPARKFLIIGVWRTNKGRRYDMKFISSNYDYEIVGTVFRQQLLNANWTLDGQRKVEIKGHPLTKIFK